MAPLDARDGEASGAGATDLGGVDAVAQRVEAAAQPLRIDHVASAQVRIREHAVHRRRDVWMRATLRVYLVI